MENFFENLKENLPGPGKHHILAPGPIFESRHTLMVDDGRDGKRARGTGSDVTQVKMGGEGVRVMPGSGERSKSNQGVDRAVQIYDNGVESGDLTANHGCKWADTLANREEEVATTAFWGQIATYLTSMEYREGTVILYFNKLFNLARQQFLPAGIVGVGTKGVISSWSKGGTVLQRAGGGFNCRAT